MSLAGRAGGSRHGHIRCSGIRILQALDGRAAQRSDSKGALRKGGNHLEQFVTKLLLCIATGIMVWVASLPCIALIIVFNRNYIFSVLCSFLYALMGFIVTNATIQTEAPNIFMILPVNTINRWLLPFFQNLDTAKYPFDIGPSSVNAIICVVYLFVYALVFGWIICNRFKKWDN